MKKAELVEAMMEGADLPSKKKAQEVVDLMFETITKTLKKGGEVAVTGFGTFKTSKRAARNGINPKTGESIKIPAATVAKFKAGKLLKEAVNKK
ncbi:MAG: HU family DNA-binding protein [bacterium]|nr:HU family DNA-binding protein [bacterium]